MFAIIDIVVVFGAVAAGYLMEHGNIRVLLQPSELIMIGRCRHRHDPHRQPSSHSQPDCRRSHRRFHWLPIQQAGLH
jgi:hypothetical protein